MGNWLLVDTATGIINNATSSPNADVKPVIQEPAEALIEVSGADFEDVFYKRKTRYNSATGQVEPEIIGRLALLESPNIPLGKTTLTFQQQDLSGSPAVFPTSAEVIIRGESQSVTIDDGVLEVEFDCAEATSFSLRITAPRQEAFETVVVASV